MQGSGRLINDDYVSTARSNRNTNRNRKQRQGDEIVRLWRGDWQQCLWNAVSSGVSKLQPTAMQMRGSAECFGTALDFRGLGRSHIFHNNRWLLRRAGATCATSHHHGMGPGHRVDWALWGRPQPLIDYSPPKPNVAPSKRHVISPAQRAALSPRTSTSPLPQ